MKVPGNIEEMARVLDACPFIGASIGCDKHDGSIKIAEYLYNAGHRKQKEGEWVDADPNGSLYRFTCSLCRKTKLGKGTPYCPNCGAHMKGGTE